MKKFTLNLKIVFSFAICIVLCVFTAFHVAEENTILIQNILIKYYNNDEEASNIKRYEINVTNTGFCWYRKVFNNGKQEYFAFNFARLKSIDYYGTNLKGKLYLHTNGDDVIVQTRNDRKGDVDSMSRFVVIPLKNIDADELNALAAHFKRMNTKVLVQK
ncbi:hypothetical protein [Pedobacter cryotolerans]|uniref:Uncharacterized protein n=1 Tax=Pedobacter cryotolerans TaxID=2571270 RepID=A0A4V6WMV5_9SPHI|nr:hypothetical protein [Pedobacter cryotolerans]TKB96543.1 hypothetical protein FA045_17945 [Pedobacter cryotolerans]